jgi:hypothetical protein
MNITVGPKIHPSNISTQMTSPTAGGYLDTKFKQAQGTATAGTFFDISLSIPAGVKLISTSLRVDTALSSSDGGTSFTAQFTGGNSNIVSSTGAFAQNTKVNKFHDTIGSETTTTTNLRITCNGSKTFASGGQITAVCYYQEIQSLNNV